MTNKFAPKFVCNGEKKLFKDINCLNKSQYLNYQYLFSIRIFGFTKKMRLNILSNKQKERQYLYDEDYKKENEIFSIK